MNEVLCNEQVLLVKDSLRIGLSSDSFLSISLLGMFSLFTLLASSTEGLGGSLVHDTEDLICRLNETYALSFRLGKAVLLRSRAMLLLLLPYMLTRDEYVRRFLADKPF